MPFSQFDVSFFGQGRVISATVVSKRNTVALTPGRYLFRVSGDSCHVRQGGVAVSAATTDMLLLNGDLFVVEVPDDVGSAFVAIRANATAANVYAVGTDPITSQNQPPAWA